jgi:hypothetical protein
MNWNHRIINCPSENGGDDYFVIKEVFYDEDDKPHSYSDSFMGSDDIEGLRLMMIWFNGALEKPTMHEDDFNSEVKA